MLGITVAVNFWWEADQGVISYRKRQVPDVLRHGHSYFHLRQVTDGMVDRLGRAMFVRYDRLRVLTHYI